MVNARVFKPSLHDAKCALHRATNAIFGKVGRLSSEEVLLHNELKVNVYQLCCIVQKFAH